jgi:peptidoglycan/xylan/chitin deacetylase (PgdA/CDA1 family)
MSGIKRIKATAKHIIYESGALSAFRRLRKDAFTSILFHRVLPANDPRAKTADPAYTMNLETFEKCLDALCDWYEPVSIEDVESAYAGRSRLPRNALLITFDDGWEDTARYAVPALRKRNMPCLIFITTGAIGQENIPWSDVVACAWRAGTLAVPTNHASTNLDSILNWLKMLPVEDRDRILRQAIDTADTAVRPLMMSPETVRQLANAGIGLGGHGNSHIPMTTLADVDQELLDCRLAFEQFTGRSTKSFAFPHGLYSESVLRATQRAGYEFVFTSDRHLNPLQQGHPTVPVFGRIPMSEEDVTDGDGRLNREKLAYWLTLQPVACPA